MVATAQAGIQITGDLDNLYSLLFSCSSSEENNVGASYVSHMFGRGGSPTVFCPDSYDQRVVLHQGYYREGPTYGYVHFWGEAGETVDEVHLPKCSGSEDLHITISHDTTNERGYYR